MIGGSRAAGSNLPRPTLLQCMKQALHKQQPFWGGWRSLRRGRNPQSAVSSEQCAVRSAVFSG